MSDGEQGESVGEKGESGGVRRRGRENSNSSSSVYIGEYMSAYIL